jgi:hypothetical protein
MSDSASPTPAHATLHAGNPGVGSSVVIVPAVVARILSGKLLWWDGTRPEAVEAVVDITPADAHGRTIPVWATLRGGSDTVVLSALARSGTGEHTVLLTGRVAARESRRSSVRADAQLDVTLTLPGRAAQVITGRTLDLSVSGCRVVLAQCRPPAQVAAPPLVAGDPTTIVLHLGRDTELELCGRVQAVRPSGQVIVCFADVPPELSVNIERYVFSTLP